MNMGEGLYQNFPMVPNKYDAQYKLFDDKGRFELSKDKAGMNKWRVPTISHSRLPDTVGISLVGSER